MNAMQTTRFAIGLTDLDSASSRQRKFEGGGMPLPFEFGETRQPPAVPDKQAVPKWNCRLCRPGVHSARRIQRSRPYPTSTETYATAFFACFLTLAQRFRAAAAIFARPASDSTRFFTASTSRSAECPNAFAAVRTPSNCPCSLCNCFSNFFSSRLIAAKIFIDTLRKETSPSTHSHARRSAV
jgi:hypothetical protein